MIGPAHHALAKRLSSLLQPFLDLNSSHCINDFSTFEQTIQQLHLLPEAIFLCFFDISNLFTNISPSETIDICADSLYYYELVMPTIPKALFTELPNALTTSVEFSFSSTA